MRCCSSEQHRHTPRKYAGVWSVGLVCQPHRCGGHATPPHGCKRESALHQAPPALRSQRFSWLPMTLSGLMKTAEVLQGHGSIAVAGTAIPGRASGLMRRTCGQVHHVAFLMRFVRRSASSSVRAGSSLVGAGDALGGCCPTTIG